MAGKNPEALTPTSQETTTTKGCGIQDTILGAPTVSSLCHCDNCHKASGSGFATNGRFAKDQFTVPHGQHLLRTFNDTDTDTDSGLRSTDFIGLRVLVKI